MFHLRRSAFRLLSSPSTSALLKTRSLTTAPSSWLRVSRAPATAFSQRRWATGEAEAEKEDAPISQIQATSQEEVENAINSDNATEISSSAPETEPSPEKSSEQSMVDNATKSVSEAASSITEAASTTYDRVASVTSDAMGGDGRDEGRDDFRGRSRRNAEPKSTIYIGNLFFDVTENDLVKELTRFGTVTKARLMRDNRGLSKGFGYVDFETTLSATKAIESLNQQLFEGRRLTVQYAAYETKTIDSMRSTITASTRRPLNPPSKTLFIGNMSFEMSDRDLNNLFKGIRNVIDVRVAIDRRTGQPRGFAHADFVDVKSAMEAMKILEEKETYGRKLRLDYSYGASNSPRNQETGSRGTPEE